MKGVREGYIDVPGGRIWYRMAGIGGKGAPLLVLHGGPGAPHDYLEPLEVLADERPVVFYDQLGCGNSDKPDDPSLWTIARHVAEIECVRKALGLERVHILGQSWGSMLAVDYMLTKKPAGVMGLIFSGPCLSASRFAADQRANLSRMPEETQNDNREGSLGRIRFSGISGSHAVLLQAPCLPALSLARLPQPDPRKVRTNRLPVYVGPQRVYRDGHSQGL